MEDDVATYVCWFCVSAFQFCYTTTFGAYCAYVFVRTGMCYTVTDINVM